MTDITDRLRSAFKAWGLRSLGDEAADEIERLRETLTAVRDTIEHNPDSINEGAIVCTVWFSPIETMVDFIDAALNFHVAGEKE